MYHGQCAWYLRGLEKNGIALKGARIAAVEKEEPFANADFGLEPKWIDRGEALADELLEKFVDESPASYGRSVLPMPEWADTESLELTIGGEAVEV